MTTAIRICILLVLVLAIIAMALLVYLLIEEIVADHKKRKILGDLGNYARLTSKYYGKHAAATYLDDTLTLGEKEDE